MHWLIAGIAVVVLFFAKKAKAAPSTPFGLQPRPVNLIRDNEPPPSETTYQISPIERSPTTTRSTIRSPYTMSGTQIPKSTDAISAPAPTTMPTRSTGTMSYPSESYIPPGKTLPPTRTAGTYIAPTVISAPSNVSTTMPPVLTTPVSQQSATNVIREAARPIYVSGVKAQVN